jgi:Bax protein
LIIIRRFGILRVAMRQFSVLSLILTAFSLVSVIFFTQCEEKKKPLVKPFIVKVDSLEQILPLDDSIVRPVLYTHVKGLNHLPGKAAREKFIAVVLPSVLVAKHQVEQERKQLLTLHKKEIWNNEDSSFYSNIQKRFKAKSVDDALSRIGTLPNSLVLAQAAIESGWGQSRFFLEGNNLFGMWSYNSFEPRIAAGKTRAKKRIYLRAYVDISQSITHYFDILSKSWAYKSLRKTRQSTSNPYELLPHLQNFSERRTVYTNQLKKVIDQYDLTRFDNYTLDPEFVMVE